MAGASISMVSRGAARPICGIVSSPICRNCRSDYFQHTKTGDLMSRMTNDIQAVRELTGVRLPGHRRCHGRDYFQSQLHDQHRSLAHSLVDAGDAADHGGGAFLRPAYLPLVAEYGQEQLSVMSAYVQENLAGVRVVQVYAQEQNQFKGFRADQWALTQKHVARHSYGEFFGR